MFLCSLAQALYGSRASMADTVTHRALIRWSAEQERRGLPTFVRTTDPTWRIDEVPKKDEGWSLMCNFESPPAAQGNPSVAHVRYLMPNAPHHLAPGLRLRLFERGTNQFAEVEILD
jgi:hypothetical protein